MRARLSIRAQVMVLSLLPAVCIALLLASLFNWLRSRDADMFLQERGSAIAQRLAQESELAIFAGNEDTLRHEAERGLQEPDVLAVRIRDAAGQSRVWRRGGGLAAAAPGSFPVDGGSLVFSAPIVQRQIAVDDFPAEGASAEGDGAVGRRKRIGDVAIEISPASTRARQQRQVLAGSLFAAACLALTALLAMLLSSRLIRPIRAMAGSVDRLAEGRLQERIEPPPTRELAVLARGINRMADQVQSVQRGLEARVEEATRELTAQKQAAESANAAKGRFLSAASHNVRQPMHALGLFVDALKRRVHDRESRHLVECVEACAGSMGGLLNAVLDLSRMEAGVLRPDVRAFAVSPLMYEVHLALSAPAMDKGLSLRVVPCTAWVRSDPAIVETILMNFVSNAIRYTSQGGILIGARRRGPRLVIEVWDSGMGIRPEEQQRIFDEFYQVAGVPRGPDRGLGLGLAVVRALAELLQAPVGVRSTPGRGSVFSLSLPLVQSGDGAVAAGEAPDLPPAGLQGMRVAVVDDDPRIVQAMQVLLGDWGCTVIASSSLEGVLGRLAEAGGAPDAVVSDLRLPEGGSGLAVIAGLRARFGAALPAFLLTGDTGTAVQLAAQEAGLPLLHKPIQPARLRAVLSHARAQRR